MKRFLLICFVIIGVAYSQTTNPCKWEYKVNMLNNCEAEIVLTAKVDKGWHLYSQKHVNGLPLVFEFEPSTYFSRTGAVTEPESHKEYDDIFAYDVFYFKESEIIFKQKIKITSSKIVPIAGKITGQVCQYESGICMPLNIDFKVDSPACP